MIAQQPSTVTENNEEDHNALFYNSFSDSSVSPISELNIHYQKNGYREPLKSCFVDFKSKFDDGTIWWRVMFRCPISGKKFHSSLPLSSLVKVCNFSNETKTNGGQHQTVSNDLPKAAQSSLYSDDVCGEYRMDDECIYFKTIKNARKSVAIRVLETFSVERKQTMFQSVAEYQQQTGQKSIVIEEKILTEGSDTCFQQQNKESCDLSFVHVKTPKTRFMKSCPKWVNQLYDLGIDSTCFILEFKERITEDTKIRQKKPLCKSDPTLMFCTLSLYRPLALTAESKSYQSKIKCIADVVDLVENEVRKKMSEQSFDAHIKEFITKHDNDQWEEKEKMVEMVPKLATYVMHPPLCMTAPIFVPVVNDPQIVGTPKVQVYLYEITLTTTNGDNFFSKLGLHISALTRIGIMCGRDLFDYGTGESPPPHSSDEILLNDSIVDFIAAKFNLPQREISSGIISLTNRSVLECDKDKLNLLRAFNITLDSWQTYGLAKYPREVDGVTELENTEWNKIIGSSRKCLFMPLTSVSSREEYHMSMIEESYEQCIDIDWGMINTIMSCQNKSYILPFDNSKEYKYIFGYLQSITLMYISTLVAFSAIIPKVYGIIAKDHKTECSSLELIIFFFAVSFSGVFLFIHYFPPREEVSFSVLQNRFLLQRKAAPRIYVADLNETKTEVKGTSSFPPKSSRDGEHSPAHSKWKHPNTYTEYYHKRYGVTLRYPSRRLLSVRGISSTKEAFRRSIDFEDHNKTSSGLYIVPELVTVLPMPRDFIYFYHNLASFMQPLERSIALKGLELRMHELKRNIPHHVLNTSSHFSELTSSKLQINRSSSKLLHLLEEGTTLHPCIMYQRLEHIGDSVIGYFTAMNIIGRNYSLNWDSEDLGRIKADAVKNTVFFETALEVGLASILGVSTNKWESIYKQNTLLLLKKYVGSLQDEDCVSLYNSIELSDKVLSDVLESILGAAFRADDVQLIKSILEELRIPLYDNDVKINVNGENWYQAFGTCIRQGYNFEDDFRWTAQIKQIHLVLHERNDIMTQLDTGCKELFLLLSKNCDISLINQNSQDNSFKKIIVMCSLFDDSLGTDEYESDSCHEGSSSSGYESDGLVGLQRIALFRDTLFFLGHSALLLCTCNELFEMNPNASAGDLHLLRACATSDDVLAYITIKNGIHNFLYDNDAAPILLLKSEIEKSDKIGISTWNNNGGWFLKGGVEEFFRRWCSKNWSSPYYLPTTTNSVQPRYAGLVGGRLMGQKSKLPEKLTGDLSFSLKALMGAFVMAHGLDKMWTYFLPLFKEVLMFTPDELRMEFCLISTLSSNYQKGHTSDILENYLSKRTTY